MTDAGGRARAREAEAPGSAALAMRLRALRARIGMTRRQLAAASGASERYLANIEQGIGNPSLGVLINLAAALDIAVAELLPQGGEQSALREQAAAAMRRLPEAELPALLDGVRRLPSSRAAKAGRIALIGLRGAGKSTLGAALAKRLDLPFLEISKEVARVYGGDIGLLIELLGQGTLRRYEREAWEAILAGHEAAVIAAPGGIVADPTLYDRLLTTAHVVWLEATPDDHMDRVMAQGDFRPMASNRGAMADLQAILDARSGEYARAGARLNTSAQDFAATLDRLQRIAAELLAAGHAV